MEDEKLRTIQKRLGARDYLLGTMAREQMEADVRFLLERLDAKDRHIADLEEQNKTLAARSLELVQEIENTKADFGGDFR